MDMSEACHLATSSGIVVVSANVSIRREETNQAGV